MADSYNFSNTEYRRKLRIHSVIRLIVCILLTVISLLPIYIILINATRANADIISNGISFLPGTNIIENFKNMTDPSYANGVYYRIFNVLVGYRNSLFISISATILTVFFSAMTAYGLSVYDFKGKKFATTFILLVMMVPSQVVSTGFLEFMASLKLLNNYIPLIIPAIAAPATVFFMLQYMKSSFPLDIVEAARIDGASKPRILTKITIPMMAPSITICTFLTLTNSFKLFDQNLALTNGMPIDFTSGVAVKKTQMLALDIYNTFYANNNFRGVGQAKAVVFFVVVAGIALLQLYFTRKREVQQ